MEHQRSFSAGRLPRHINPRLHAESTTASGHYFLQEVTPEVRAALLNNPRIQSSFLATDAEDTTAFDQVPFATMSLLSRSRFAASEQREKGEGEAEKLAIRRVSRISLPSMYKRDALCLEVVPPDGSAGKVVSLVNVHLDSLWPAFAYRAQQIQILADMLREPGCKGGIIAGDFNAISPKDHELVSENRLVDAWEALRGTDATGGDGATWGTGLQQASRRSPGRLDKIVMTGLTPEEIAILQLSGIEVPRPGKDSISIPWSDHAGLLCTLGSNSYYND